MEVVNVLRDLQFLSWLWACWCRMNWDSSKWIMELKKYIPRDIPTDISALCPICVWGPITLMGHSSLPITPAEVPTLIYEAVQSLLPYKSTLQDLDGGPDLENNVNTDAEGSKLPEWFPYPT
ncbi:hypothetical protein B0H14DRAFT_2623537 [Mycena olivaceomarginata]|nr:hypothetical protein B0H14DRAFT_2623537 [Mycena olivaceomarginata]